MNSHDEPASAEIVVRNEVVLSAVAEPLVRAFFKGKSEKTIAAYRADLVDFSCFLTADTIARSAQMLLAGTAPEANFRVLAYRATLIERGLSPATVNRRLAAIRSLLKLAKSLGLVTWEIIAKNARVIPYRDTRGPTVTNIRRLLAAIYKRRDPQGVRDFALLRLLYDLALRRNEAVTLDVSNVEIERGVVHVIRKGYSERKPMTLAAPTLDAIKEWLAVRGNDDGPLFINFDHAAKGNRLTGVSVNRVVARWGSKIGLRLTAHQLRHAAITHALDATNGDVRAVARFSGHRQLQTLVVYDDNRADMAGEISRALAASADPSLSL